MDLDNRDDIEQEQEIGTTSAETTSATEAVDESYVAPEGTKAN